MSDDVQAMQARIEELERQRQQAETLAEMKRQAAELEKEIRELNGITQQDAYAAYGRPGVGAGQPPARPGAHDEQIALLEKLKGHGGGERRTSTADDARRYLRLRTQEVITTAKAMGWTHIGTKQGQHLDRTPGR